MDAWYAAAEGHAKLSLAAGGFRRSAPSPLTARRQRTALRRSRCSDATSMPRYYTSFLRNGACGTRRRIARYCTGVTKQMGRIPYS